jgi:hypothetical protein
MDVFMEWISPGSTDPINKFEFYALGSDKLVYKLGTGGVRTVTPVAGGYKYTSSLQVDLSKYCGPSGTLTAFGLAQTVTRQIYFKNNPFLSFLLAEPQVMNPYCWQPLR